MASTCSRVSCGRVAFLPVGSPIMPVKSPMRKIDLVAELLEMAHLPEQHGVAEVEVGGGGVEADLDPRAACRSFGRLPASRQIGLRNEVHGTAAEHLHLFFDRQEFARHEAGELSKWEIVGPAPRWARLRATSGARAAAGGRLRA